MPLRYAGDKLNGAAASRLTHVKVLRSVWVKCPAQADLSWERFRRELHEIDEHAVRREVADMILDDVVVATVAAGTIPGLKKWREITLGPCPALASRAERLQELSGSATAPALAAPVGTAAASSTTSPPSSPADLLLRFNSAVNLRGANFRMQSRRRRSRRGSPDATVLSSAALSTSSSAAWQVTPISSDFSPSTATIEDNTDTSTIGIPASAAVTTT